MNDASLAAIAVRLGELLAAGGLILATAESCTGGWISKLVTDVPGSSAWFDCGIVTYSNSAKTSLLGVGTDLIAAHGAVSGQVAGAMVSGALARSRADVAVAVSGIAGPGGGSLEKPVGTIWIAWAARGRQPEAVMLCCPGKDRDEVRRSAAGAALEGLVERIEKNLLRPLAGQ